MFRPACRKSRIRRCAQSIGRFAIGMATSHLRPRSRWPPWQRPMRRRRLRPRFRFSAAGRAATIRAGSAAAAIPAGPVGAIPADLAEAGTQADLEAATQAGAELVRITEAIIFLQNLL